MGTDYRKLRGRFGPDFRTSVPGAIVMLGAFATSYGFMMYPALIAAVTGPG